MGAKRNDQKKIRYDLIPTELTEAVAKVLTFGAKKYDANNWRLGMKWSRCIGSLERHIQDFKKGIDYDDESNLLHLGHAATNIAFLLNYYNMYPQGDDRQHTYLNHPKIGLDIDNVIADFSGYYCRKFSQEIPENWNFDRNIEEKFANLDHDFWLSIPPKIDPSTIPFEPYCYVTSRSIPNHITEQWIDDNGFPQMPVYSVGYDQSKVETIKKLNLDIFVDDRFENFQELNRAGITTYLFDQPHNRRYNVGYRRIYSLNQLPPYGNRI